MTLEIRNYTEENLEKNKNLYNAKVIDFPKDQHIDNYKNLQTNNFSTWKLYDKSNSKEDGDQLKAVLGICLMLSALTIMGLYSNLI